MSGHGSTDNFTVVSTRRIWSQSEKLLIVSEAVAPGTSICAVARRHNLSSSLLYRWIKYFKADEPVQRPAFVPVALVPPAAATASGLEPSLRRPDRFLGREAPTLQIFADAADR